MSLNLNQTLQSKYPHLEISVSNFQNIDKEYLIFGSDFNSKSKEKSLLAIKSDKKVCDYFDLISKTYKKTDEISYIYDLTHSLGNFLQDAELSNDLGSGKKIAIKNDFVISRLRSYLQEMAVVQPKKYKQFFSTEYLVYRPKTNEVSSNTLLAFSLSKYVQNILNKSQYGTEHPRFYEFVFNEMPIPSSVLNLNNEIDKLMEKAYQNLEESKALYAKAEALLYAELGLNPHNPLDFIEQKSSGSLNISVRTLKQSFLATGRLDSEYYQNKYDEIERVIKNYQGGYGKISDYFKQNKKSKSFTLPEYKYIEIGDINTGTGTANYNIIQTNDLPANAKIFLNNGDLLISKVRPNRGAVAIVNFDENDLIGSGAFCVLQEVGEIKKEVLMILLRTPLYKEWLLKFNVGTSYPVIKDEDIFNLIIPKIAQATQTQIADLLKQSFLLRKLSSELLETAKAKVETAIEQG